MMMCTSNNLSGFSSQLTTESGKIHSLLVASLAVQESGVTFMPTACPIIQLSQIQRNCPQAIYFYVLNIIKPPNSTPWQTDTEPVCFAFSIP
jgi:hypothetical protein